MLALVLVLRQEIPRPQPQALWAALQLKPQFKPLAQVAAAPQLLEAPLLAVPLGPLELALPGCHGMSVSLLPVLALN